MADAHGSSGYRDGLRRLRGHRHQGWCHGPRDRQGRSPDHEEQGRRKDANRGNHVRPLLGREAGCRRAVPLDLRGRSHGQSRDEAASRPLRARVHGHEVRRGQPALRPHDLRWLQGASRQGRTERDFHAHRECTGQEGRQGRQSEDAGLLPQCLFVVRDRRRGDGRLPVLRQGQVDRRCRECHWRQDQLRWRRKRGNHGQHGRGEGAGRLLQDEEGRFPG